MIHLKVLITKHHNSKGHAEHSASVIQPEAAGCSSGLSLWKPIRSLCGTGGEHHFPVYSQTLHG